MSYRSGRKARFYIDRPLAYRPDRVVVPFRADFHSADGLWATTNDGVPGGYISLVTPDVKCTGVTAAYSGGPAADGSSEFMSQYQAYTVLSSKMVFSVQRHISPGETEETDSWLIPLMVGITQGSSSQISEVAVGTTATPSQESVWSIEDRRDTAWEIMAPRQQSCTITRTWNLAEDAGVKDPWDSSQIDDVWVQATATALTNDFVFRGFIGRYVPFGSSAFTGPGNGCWWRVQVYYVVEFRYIIDTIT